MKVIPRLIKTLLAGLFITTAIDTVSAAVAHTNAVQFINLQLTLLTQGAYETNSPKTNDIAATAQTTKIATKDVISWLGAATTNSFSPRARLVRVRHFNSGGDDTTVEIRDGTNAPVDVTAFFSSSTSSNKVDVSILNTLTGLRTGKELEVFHLVMTNAPGYNLAAHFHAAGFATVSYVAVKSGNTVLIADELKAPALAGAGAGTDGVGGLISGSLTVTGTVREVK